MPDIEGALSAGFDVGGTKIEATLFDGAFRPLTLSRRATPRGSYDQLVGVLVEEIGKLRAQSGRADLPVGLGLPGLIDPETEISLTANLPATGRPLARDLKDAVGGLVVAENDCKCFALSEANGGSGAGSRSVFGLILGTGLGGGMCRDGMLVPGLNHIAGEVGHFGLPAALVQKFDLPILSCGCGRVGCYETLISGTGLAALCRAVTGQQLSAPDIAVRATNGDAQLAQVMGIWAELAAEHLHTLQLHLDPDVIVLGGGLSNIAGLDGMLGDALRRVALPTLRLPAIRKPTFGDSSGARGAAILALRTFLGETA